MLVNLGVYSLDQLRKISAILLLYRALVDDRVQRVPHLVRNCRVDQRGELILSLHVVIENFRRDVDKLEQILLFLVFLDVDSLFNLKVHEAWQVLFGNSN